MESLRRVADVKLTAGVRYHIAFCEEKLGQTATALAHYVEAREAAEREHNKDVLDLLADPFLPSLRARVPTLTIEVLPDAAGAEVTIDGASAPAGLWGVAVPVDPGAHHIEAHAPGREPFARDLSLREREVTVLDVVPADPSRSRLDSAPRPRPVDLRLDAPTSPPTWRLDLDPPPRPVPSWSSPPPAPSPSWAAASRRTSSRGPRRTTRARMPHAHDELRRSQDAGAHLGRRRPRRVDRRRRARDHRDRPLGLPADATRPARRASTRWPGRSSASKGASECVARRQRSSSCARRDLLGAAPSSRASISSTRRTSRPRATSTPPRARRGRRPPPTPAPAPDATVGPADFCAWDPATAHATPCTPARGSERARALSRTTLSARACCTRCSLTTAPRTRTAPSSARAHDFWDQLCGARRAARTCRARCVEPDVIGLRRAIERVLRGLRSATARTPASRARCTDAIGGARARRARELRRARADVRNGGWSRRLRGLGGLLHGWRRSRLALRARSSTTAIPTRARSIKGSIARASAPARASQERPEPACAVGAARLHSRPRSRAGGGGVASGMPVRLPERGRLQGGPRRHGELRPRLRRGARGTSRARAAQADAASCATRDTCAGHDAHELRPRATSFTAWIAQRARWLLDEHARARCAGRVRATVVCAIETSVIAPEMTQP